MEEVSTSRDGREFKMYFTVWLGEGHGLRVGDSARFTGSLGAKTREYDGKTYMDLSISNGRYDPATLKSSNDVSQAMPDGWGEEDGF